MRRCNLGWQTTQRVVLLGLCLVTSCTKRDPNQTKLQYMPDMADTPIVKPHRSYLDPPEGSVRKHQTYFGKDREEADLLVNPFTSQGPAASVDEESGAFLWGQVCMPCHGVEGRSDGPMSDVYLKPPVIVEGDYLNKTDGFFFHTITYGVGMMPHQGDKLYASERWQVVLHLRKLQKKRG